MPLSFKWYWRPTTYKNQAHFPNMLGFLIHHCNQGQVSLLPTSAACWNFFFFSSQNVGCKYLLHHLWSGLGSLCQSSFSPIDVTILYNLRSAWVSSSINPLFKFSHLGSSPHNTFASISPAYFITLNGTSGIDSNAVVACSAFQMRLFYVHHVGFCGVSKSILSSLLSAEPSTPFSPRLASGPKCQSHHYHSSLSGSNFLQSQAQPLYYPLHRLVCLRALLTFPTCFFQASNNSLPYNLRPTGHFPENNYSYVHWSYPRSQFPLLLS